MTQRTTYPEGAPCWADLSTPDLQGALRFYGPLLGWTFDEPVAEMGYYTTARKDGLRVAGLAPLVPEMGFPPAWSLYMWTNDADATAARVADAGGRLAMDIMDIGDLGRMLFGFDTTGASFGAWQPRQHTGSELYAAPGALCWAELNTRDGAAADMFYKRTFGYRAQNQIGDGDKFDYTVWTAGDEEVCGRLRMTAPDFPEDAAPHWLLYFAIDDVDAATARIPELGGKVLEGPLDSPYGRIATVQDPYGVKFALIQPTPESAA